MIRSEFAANQALATRTTQAAWAKPSTCYRPAKTSILRRLISLFA